MHVLELKKNSLTFLFQTNFQHILLHWASQNSRNKDTNKQNYEMIQNFGLSTAHHMFSKVHIIWFEVWNIFQRCGLSSQVLSTFDDNFSQANKCKFLEPQILVGGRF